MADRTLSSADAQAMQEADPTLIWIVTHAGRWIARPHTSDHSGGRSLHSVLLANGLDELRAMLPRALRRDPPASFWPPEVMEMWSAE